MRVLILTILFFTLMYCGTKNTTQIDSQTNGAGSGSKTSDGENFDDFFSKFSTDSIFQRERVKFPFISEILNTDTEQPYFDTITASNWRFATFEYKEEYGKRKIDAYTQQTKNYYDSAIIEIRGVDNGIHMDFKFFKINGKWFLVSENDYSN